MKYLAVLLFAFLPLSCIPLYNPFTSDTYMKDKDAPDPGNSGLLSISNVQKNSISVSWTKAGDDLSPREALQYRLFYSELPLLNTVSLVLANGTPAGNWTTDIDQSQIEGLTENTKYYINLLVKDTSGRTGIYEMTDTDTDYDRLGYTFEFSFGSGGMGDNQYDLTSGIVFDSDGNMYITDFYNHRIEKLTASGSFLGWYGKDSSKGTGWHEPGTAANPVPGSGDGEFSEPLHVSIAMAGTTGVLFVPSWSNSESDNHSVQKITIGSTPPLSFMEKWGGVEGSDDTHFSFLTSVKIDKDNNVWIADNGNHRIKKYSVSGTFLGWWGKDNTAGTGWHSPGTATSPVSGSGDGEFNYIGDIALDNYGYLYAADYTNNRIEKFLIQADGSLAFKGWWGKDGTSGTGWHDPGTASNPAAGTGDGEFNVPVCIYVDNLHYLYEVDQNNHRVQKFRTNGTFIGWYGKDSSKGIGWYLPGEANTPVSGTENGAFTKPRDITVYEGKVYVTDGGNNRIQVFNKN
ncbi:MAG: hypothetical protein JXB88_19410 [Spirochaetales bacterium]|nr:hypothetical protein [Spirochaetales bacterium]